MERSSPKPPKTPAPPAETGWRFLLAAFLVPWAMALLTACGPGASDRGESEGSAGGGISQTPPNAAQEPASVAQEPAQDVILITLDTLRDDALRLEAAAAEGPWRTPAPHLERLAREGRVFSFALAHNTITLPSHANILTGLYPYQHGIRENAEHTLGVPTAATLFAAQGFATGAFISAYVLDARFGLAEGFEVYDDQIERAFEPSAVRVWERKAPQTVAAALDWWRGETGRRRFLWLHLFEPHAPYAPPEPFAERFAQPYRGEVAALDAFLAEVLEQARQEERAPFVVLTSDHGESLGDHGEPAHGIFAYQSTLEVPLVLWGPGVSPGVDDRLARHVDILPTLLGASGLGLPAVAAGAAQPPGASLLAPPPAGVTSYFECLSATFDSGWAPLRGLVEGRLKVIDLPLPELYDLAADPGEQHNLVSERRRDFHRLRDLLPTESAWPPRRGELSDEAAARLRSLGYLSDDASEVAASFGVEDDPKRWIHLEQLKQSYAEHFRSGLFGAAIADAEAMLRERPSMSLAHRMLAEAQLAGGRLGEAVATMRAAWRGRTASPFLLRLLARTLAEGGESAEALKVLEPLAGDGDIDTRSLYGQVLRAAGHPRRAEEVLRAVVRESPEHALTWERLSAAALDLGRPREAESHARRALALNGALAQSWNNLGVALVMTGRTEEGLNAWQEALERDPELWDTLYNLAFQAARAGRLELARSSLERFLAEAPPARYAPDLSKARALLDRLRD